MTALGHAIRGGTAVTPDGVIRVDIGIAEGRIAAIGGVGPAAGEVGGSGVLVPLGIDAHVHPGQPTSDGTVIADGFESATRVAAGATARCCPSPCRKRTARSGGCVEAGVSKGRITSERFVELASANSAKLYGLHPRKGQLSVGADADIAIRDPVRKATIRPADLQSWVR